MSYGPIVAYVATMASGGTSTSEVNLQRAYKNAYLVIQSMPSNSQLHIQASDASGGTFRRVYHPMSAADGSNGVVFAIHSAVTNAIIPIPSGLKFMKVEVTMAIDNGTTFKIICSD